MTTLKRKSVLFLCTGNSARSQLAQALLTHRAGDFFEVSSAGTHPETVDVRVIKVLSDIDVDTHLLHSKPLSEFSKQRFDTVITLCDEAQAQCREYENANQQLAWHLPDPKTRLEKHAFAKTLQEIDDLISLFLAVERPQNDRLLQSSQLSQGEQLPQNNQLTANAALAIDPISFYKCLTDGLRLKAVMLTHYHGELCVCELMEALDEESQPKLSRNLAVLKKAHIITSRKHGQWVFYRINPDLPQWIKTVIAQTTRHNLSLISSSIETLKLMNDRPSKNKFCG